MEKVSRDKFVFEWVEPMALLIFAGLWEGVGSLKRVLRVRTVEGMGGGTDQRQGIILFSLRKHICNDVNLHSGSG